VWYLVDKFLTHLTQPVVLKKKSYNIGFAALYFVSPKVTTFEVALMMILTS